LINGTCWKVDKDKLLILMSYYMNLSIEMKININSLLFNILLLLKIS